MSFYFSILLIACAFVFFINICIDLIDYLTFIFISFSNLVLQLILMQYVYFCFSKMWFILCFMFLFL